MGAVIAFPQSRRPVRASLAGGARDRAAVIILPVIRVERGDDSDLKPSKSPSGGKRRRRLSRS
jgi:hypothetical protein